MEWKECTYEEIEALKMEFMLEMPWESPEKNEAIWKYEEKNTPVAFVKISLDPIDKTSIWVDEFEVIRIYRKQGFGKSAISDFLGKVNADVKLLAKNKRIQLFWEKCGFKDNGITEMEIPMIYRIKQIIKKV